MDIEEERSIPFTLDKLDYEATMVGGLTQKELICTFAVFAVFFIAIFSIITKLLWDIASIGAITAFLVAGICTAKAAHTAYVVKKGRPSYMLWMDLRRKFQDEGVLFIKINFGLIRNTYWSINNRD